MHVFEELREELLVRERIAGDVAEDRDLFGLHRQAADDLHAAEQEQVVHHAHQPRGGSHFHVLRRHDHRAVFGAQARQRFVIAQLALRQADDGLQVEIDAVFFQRGTDGFQKLRLAQRLQIILRLHGGLLLEHVRRRRGHPRGVRNLAGEVAHQAFQNLQFGDDLLALRVGLGFGADFHVFDLGMRLVDDDTKFLVGLFQPGDLRAHSAFFALAQDRGMNLRDAEKHRGARQDGDGKVHDIEDREQKAADRGEHRGGEDNDGVRHRQGPEPVLAQYPLPPVANSLTLTTGKSLRNCGLR